MPVGATATIAAIGMTDMIGRQWNLLCGRNLDNSLLSGRRCVRRRRRIDMRYVRPMPVAAVRRGIRRCECNQHKDAKNHQSDSHRDVEAESHARFYTGAAELESPGGAVRSPQRAGFPDRQAGFPPESRESAGSGALVRNYGSAFGRTNI